MDRSYLIPHLFIAIVIVTILTFVPAESSAEVDYASLNPVDNINLNVKPEAGDTPLRVVIPSIGVDLNIEPKSIVNGTWPISEDKASYASESGYIDENLGNVIVFAHARENLFKGLDQLTSGDNIMIYGNKGIYNYKVANSQLINPHDIDLIRSVGETNLSMFTCGGDYDEYRVSIKATRDNFVDFNNKEVI